MKITSKQLRLMIMEELSLSEIQAQKPPSGPDWSGKVPGSAEKRPGVMSSPRGAVASATGAAIKSAVQTASDLPTAYRSLQKGDSFSISIPASFASSVKAWLSKASRATGMNESKKPINEEVATSTLVAGIGVGILALCVTAMLLGYETDVDVSGEVAGQEARAKIILKAPQGGME